MLEGEPGTLEPREEQTLPGEVRDCFCSLSIQLWAGEGCVSHRVCCLCGSTSLWVLLPGWGLGTASKAGDTSSLLQPRGSCWVKEEEEEEDGEEKNDADDPLGFLR